MHVTVKYCGGCNPRHDRAALIRRLREDFPGVSLGGADGAGPEPDLVAVVCGCPSRCASHQHLVGRFGKVVLCAPEDYPALYEAAKRYQQQLYKERSL